MSMDPIEIDAKGKVLGRLATDIANKLRGKHLTSFREDRLSDITVHVKNASQVKLTGLKATQKMYYNFSGYPGGLKKKMARDLMKEHPDRVIWLAVKRMLPANKLRPRWLKHLIIDS